MCLLPLLLPLLAVGPTPSCLAARGACVATAAAAAGAALPLLHLLKRQPPRCKTAVAGGSGGGAAAPAAASALARRTSSEDAGRRMFSCIRLGVRLAACPHAARCMAAGCTEEAAARCKGQLGGCSCSGQHGSAVCGGPSMAPGQLDKGSGHRKGWALVSSPFCILQHAQKPLAHQLPSSPPQPPAACRRPPPAACCPCQALAAACHLPEPTAATASCLLWWRLWRWRSSEVAAM